MLNKISIEKNILSIEKPVIEEWCKAHNIEHDDIVMVISGDFLMRRIYKIITTAKGKSNPTTRRTDTSYMVCFFGKPKEARMFVYKKLEGDDE